MFVYMTWKIIEFVLETTRKNIPEAQKENTTLAAREMHWVSSVASVIQMACFVTFHQITHGIIFDHHKQRQQPNYVSI